MLVLIKKITLNSVLKNNIMKTILGLDLGSNSIGWAVINSVIEKQSERIIIRKSKFPQNPKRSVRFSGKGTKRSVQKRKARNTQKTETEGL